MTAEPSPLDFETLYHRAFSDYRLRALWNVRELEQPSPEEALSITRNLRVEGGLSARSRVAWGVPVQRSSAGNVTFRVIDVFPERYTKAPAHKDPEPES